MIDYEKAYKDALERAKMILCNIPEGSASVRDIETIFPELRESEDERNWKKVEGAIRGFLTNPIDADELLAWLEKQKEPHYTKRNALFDKCVENCDPEIMKRVSDEVDEMLEKEQKSVQSDAEKEYVRILKSLVADFVRANNYIERGYYQQIYDWLDGKHIEQKPAEWSEEDKSFYDSIMCEVVKEGMHPTPAQKNWLESLPERFNLQPKQEWSEEDEDNLKRVVWIVEENDSDFRELTNWLKSLRNRVGKEFLQPHWKPSEEQMKALLGAEGISRASGYPDNAKVLASLYEQIKKLM